MIFKIRELFIETIQYLDFSDILEMRTISKMHNTWIKKHKWDREIIFRSSDINGDFIDKISVSERFEWVLRNFHITKTTIMGGALHKKHLKLFENIQKINLVSTPINTDILTFNGTHFGIKYAMKIPKLYLKNCVHLNLAKSLLNDDLIENIPEWNLTYLNLRDTNIRNDQMKYLSGIKNLNLSLTDITDEGLNQLKDVEIINLESTLISGSKDYDFISVNLLSTSITDDTLKYFRKAKRIVVDEISSVKYLKNCEVLEIYNHSIPDEEFHELKNCKALSVSNIGNKALQEFTELDYLNLEYTDVEQHVLDNIKVQVLQSTDNKYLPGI